MIQGKFIVGLEGLKETGFIRYQVFTEDQGVPPEEEQDFYDHFAHHLLVLEGDEPVGTGRLIIKDGAFLIGRIAVLPSFRGKGYGEFVVRVLVDRAFLIGAKSVEVHSQLHAVKFYEKLGFEAYGAPYIESGIEHVSMKIQPGQMTSDCGHCQ